MSDIFPQGTGTLTGHVAFVTGGTRGIGRAIVLALAAAGARVAFCHHRDGARAAALTAGRDDLFAFEADVSDEAAVCEFFDQARVAFGPPGIVISNAGILHEAPLVETAAADFDRIIAVNLRGTFLVAREAARRMRPGGPGAGRIITIASDLGHLGRENMAGYTASKGGVISLTRSLARELAPRILVNAIAPGAIDTDMTSPASMSAEALARDLDTPLARLGQPEEIAAMTVFLAGPGAAFMTGQVLGINGGSAMN